ncbi:MAG: hypothetical protein WCJ81_01895 [bacterium]
MIPFNNSLRLLQLVTPIDDQPLYGFTTSLFPSSLIKESTSLSV